MKLREAGVAERCENEEKNRSKEIKMERTKMSTTRVSRMNSASELWCEHELFVGRHTHLACFHAWKKTIGQIKEILPISSHFADVNIEFSTMKILV